MFVTIDNLASRYGFLPSEVLEKGTTFDLQVLDISTQYDIYLREKNDKKKTFTAPPPPPELSKEKMDSMIKKVKEQK